MAEGYRPTPDELGLAEEMMTDEQKKMSNEREKDYDVSVKSFDLMDQLSESHPEITSPELKTDLISRILEIEKQCLLLEQSIGDNKKVFEVLTAILGQMKEFYSVAGSVYKPLYKDNRSMISNAMKISRSHEGTHKEISDRFQNDWLPISYPFEYMPDSIQMVSEYKSEAKEIGIDSNQIDEIKIFLRQASKFTYGLFSFGEMLKELMENREDMIRNNYSIAYGDDAHRRSPFAATLKAEIKRNITPEVEANKIIEDAKPMQKEWEKDFNVLVDQGIDSWPEMRS